MAMQSGFIKRIRDIMRMDAGINGDAQRIEQMVWMLFLKVYDAKEDDWELNEDDYESIIPEALRWRNWAKADSNGHAMTGDKLLNFVNNILFPVLKGNRKLCIGRGLCDVVPLGGMNEKFTLNWLRCFKNAFIKKATGTTFVAITGDTVKNQVVPLPPLAEQKRIVAKIEELLLLVDRYAVAYEKLEQFNAKFPEDMKKSILQYAIQGKLVEQRTEEGTGEELYQQIQVYKKNLIKDGRLKKTRALEPISEAAIPFDFPQPWKVCYIDDIAFVTKLAGFEYTKYIADNLVADGIPLFKGKNVQNGKLVLSFESYIPKSISDELPRSQIAKKCLLTPYVGTIGNIAIFDGSFKAHLGSNVGKIELLNSDIQTFVLEEYVLWYLKSTYGYAELTKHKKATAQESISIDAIRNVIIAIPPLEEQYRIVAKIEELLPLCDRLRK